jgi:hypothetical protein
LARFSYSKTEVIKPLAQSLYRGGRLLDHGMLSGASRAPEIDLLLQYQACLRAVFERSTVSFFRD